MEHTPEQIAQWVIDNRYPKSENDKMVDSEMYHLLIDKINAREKELRETVKELRVEAERAHLHAVANGHFETAKRLLILLTRSQHLS